MDWSFRIEEQSLKHSLLRSWGLKHLLMPRAPSLTLGTRGIKWHGVFWWLNSPKKTLHLLPGLWWSKVWFICTRPAFNSSQNEWRGKIEFYTPAAMINVRAFRSSGRPQEGNAGLFCCMGACLPAFTYAQGCQIEGSLHKWIAVVRINLL